MKYRIPIVFVLVILTLAFAVCGIYYFRQKTTSHAPITGSPAVREAYWESRVRAVGPSAAYKEFGDAVAAISPGQQHDNAHTFGGALFAVVGTAGLSTCDAQYSYGCFHEFLGRAIASLGLSVVTQLNEGCVRALGANALSCQHGIGHGVEAALGYDEKSLRRALAICRDLPYTDPIGGCYGGVFMEYNTQTMLGDQGKTRTISHDDPHYPCDVLAPEFQQACVFWSPQWWVQLQHQMAHSAGGADFVKIGALCDGAGSKLLVRTCYEGIGTIVPPEAGFDPAKTRALCELVSTDKVKQLYCKAYSANTLTVGGAGMHGNGAAICEGLKGDELSFCSSYARNDGNIMNELPPIGQ